MNKHILSIFALILMISLLIPVNGWADSKLPKGKQTELGLYVTAKEAYSQWQVKPEEIKIIDVRTPEEYVFIGHPPMARNIPVMILKDKWYAAKRGGAMTPNPAFVEAIKKTFKPSDTLFLICRSGGRSAFAVNLLAKNGFKKVFTVTDGFEGGKIKDNESPNKGKRMLNGWRNSGAPWTYDIKEELSYSSLLGKNRN
jgi:rhodanese-related sulfurtransferase